MSETDATGDSSLAELLRVRLGRAHPVAAAATVARGETRAASLGTGLDSRYEIGSISKGVTGLLYVDAVKRGEVAPETEVGTLLPLGGSPAASATLAALSTHTSGLPRLAMAHVWRKSWELYRRGSNPYGESLEGLLAVAREAKVTPSPRVSYSNLGFELLGHALAAAAGTSYPALVRERIATPLGLTSWTVPTSAEELSAVDIPGRSARGRAMEPWTGEDLAPAGGIRSAVGDMARFASALLDGTAPGVAALDPVTKMSRDMRIGAAWITLEVKGRRMTWHNGGTGGFRTWMGLDREAGTAAVILSATAAPVDRQGFGLLGTLA
ncbi:beta-lactamase family protein [Salinibacterium sp. dk2585]|uniref:serine hydrolase domain-containing protein n=1 Tax=unclassified Salinibacterium TaxID=2632331 RepID=UPI0011C24DF2|nr:MULTISPECIES: serine hydrolase domain-containing protein [unclassified Salinibacterium]QEE61090.1 beta-lactamase family protein [Salinibacterium sp. dk2585]TXK53033.1 beta-lactamase family protein [Salinibacterium sp. dk5596]